MRCRVKRARVDSSAVRERILRARSNAFKGRSLGGVYVSEVVKEGSLNPIQVCPESQLIELWLS